MYKLYCIHLVIFLTFNLNCVIDVFQFVLIVHYRTHKVYNTFLCSCFSLLISRLVLSLPAWWSDSGHGMV